jgi:solute carrier family 25 (peroxisomal adenine nucleotide transporter), member 17
LTVFFNMSTKPSDAESKAQQSMAATSAAQQSDNIAHALAGAGGGLLAMTLT